MENNPEAKFTSQTVSNLGMSQSCPSEKRINFNQFMQEFEGVFESLFYPYCSLVEPEPQIFSNQYNLCVS